MRSFTSLCFVVLASLTVWTPRTSAVIRDGGIDPANLGKGDWIYYMSMATNNLGGNVPWVTNEASLMMFYRSNGVRYIIVKAATSDYLFNGSYSFPQFTRELVNIAHAYGILIFGYNRSYGENVQGEVLISDYVFQQGADGFVFDAEGEWESSQPWIGNQGPAKAWSLCSQVRSNWPNKFLAHAPFPIISYHSSFPYKEFGFWCDAVMPQIYPHGWTGVKSRPSGGINWTDANFAAWQNSLYSLPMTNINGIDVWWTNAIKPLAPANHVYGPNPPNKGVSHIDDDFVTEFVDYLCADTHAVTAGGYVGANFWRTDLHGSAQWTNIGRSTIGSFAGIVNNIVIDDPRGMINGTWTGVRTFSNGKFYGNGSGTDTNSFGTNYLVAPRGSGESYVEFRPKVVVAGVYKVYEWHPWLAGASTSAKHVVSHSEGNTAIYANQRTNAGRWSLLGQFSFDEGTNGYVRVTDAVSETSAVAIADGIKLVFVPPTSVPQGPTNLQATAISTSEIRLSWSDGATNEAAFIIYRATSQGGPYVKAGWAGVNKTSWTDNGLMDGTPYYYVVAASNVLGESTPSNKATATTIPVIPEPPVILSAPRNRGVPEGAPASFAVTAGGTQPLTYQWWFNDNPVAGATGQTLAIPAVDAASTGYYSVAITNRFGWVKSDPAVLTIVAVGVSGEDSLGQGEIPGTATGLIALRAGYAHFLGLKQDGRVCAWGANWDQQSSVPQDLGRVLAIAAGGYHSLAILEDLTVRAWGANHNGQCQVPPGLRGVICVAGGGWHSVAATRGGDVVLWGDDSWGQLAKPAWLPKIVAVAAGATHTLALAQDGTVYAWGANSDAQGMYAGQAVVPAGLKAKAIAAGDYHSLAIRLDGKVVAWGANGQWQCAVPANLTNVIGIAAGGAHSIALRRDHTVATWGGNAIGQCDVPQGTQPVVGVTAGGFNSGVLWPDGTVPLRLWAPKVGPNGFEAVVQTLSGGLYQVVAQTNLLKDALPLRVVEGNGALVAVTDTNLLAPSKFYRMSTAQ